MIKTNPEQICGELRCCGRFSRSVIYHWNNIFFIHISIDCWLPTVQWQYMSCISRMKTGSVISYLTSMQKWGSDGWWYHNAKYIDCHRQSLVRWVGTTHLVVFDSSSYTTICRNLQQSTGSGALPKHIIYYGPLSSLRYHNMKAYRRDDTPISYLELR